VVRGHGAAGLQDSWRFASPPGSGTSLPPLWLLRGCLLCGPGPGRGFSAPFLEPLRVAASLAAGATSEKGTRDEAGPRGLVVTAGCAKPCAWGRPRSSSTQALSSQPWRPRIRARGMHGAMLARSPAP